MYCSLYSFSNELDAYTEVSKSLRLCPISWVFFFFLCSLITISKQEKLKSVPFALGWDLALSGYHQVFRYINSVSVSHWILRGMRRGEWWHQREKHWMASRGSLIKQTLGSSWNSSFMGPPAGTERQSYNASQMETLRPLNCSKLIEFI